jgi:predicted Zn-dependent protease
MRAIVAVIAVVAAAVVAGVVYATRQDPAQPTARCKKDVGAVIFPGVESKNVAAVRTALGKTPARAARAVEALAAEQPKDPVVQFNYGWALYCGGFDAEAVQALRKAKKDGRDTGYEVVADDILHPQYFQNGYPPFEYEGHDRLLIQGQVAQRNYHERTAGRLWARAAKLHPNDADAQVAAAVGRFDKDDLSASFSRLGPLTRRFPRSQVVRFYLGLMLAWTAQRDQALVEFKRTYALGPTTELGQGAKQFIDRVGGGGTDGSNK